MVRKESQETLRLVTQAPQESGVFQESQGLKGPKVKQDILGLKGQLAVQDCRGSRVPKAEKVELDFQGSQDYLAIPVKEALQVFQDNPVSPELQVVQVSQVGKGHKEIWDLLDQLE